MSYPGDPAGNQQPAYQFQDGNYPPPPTQDGPGYPPPGQPGGFGAPPQGQPGGLGYPPQQGQPGGFGAPPQSGPPAQGAGSQAGFPPPSFGPEQTAPYGYDPNAPQSGPAFGGPPMSGPAFGGPPMSGPAFGGPGAPGAAPRRGRRGPATAILGSLAVLFLLATAVLAVLFLGKSGDYDEQKRTATQRQETIDTLNKDVSKLKDDVKRIEGERDNAKRDLGGAQGQADELKRQKQVISRCLTLAAEVGDAAEKGDNAAFQAKRKEAEPVCAEADKYLD